MKLRLVTLAAVLVTVCPALAAPLAPIEKPPSPSECLVKAFEDGWGASPAAGKGVGPTTGKGGPDDRDACVHAGYWVKIQSDGSQADAARLTKFAAAIQLEQEAKDHEQQLTEQRMANCFLLSLGVGLTYKKQAEAEGCPN